MPETTIPEVKVNLVSNISHYELRYGDFCVKAAIDTVNKRISLSKSPGERGGLYDYHFQESTPDKVEAFATCALQAVEILKATV